MFLPSYLLPQVFHIQRQLKPDLAVVCGCTVGSRCGGRGGAFSGLFQSFQTLLHLSDGAQDLRDGFTVPERETRKLISSLKPLENTLPRLFVASRFLECVVTCKHVCGLRSDTHFCVHSDSTTRSHSCTVEGVTSPVESLSS